MAASLLLFAGANSGGMTHASPRTNVSWKCDCRSSRSRSSIIRKTVAEPSVLMVIGSDASPQIGARKFLASTSSVRGRATRTARTAEATITITMTMVSIFVILLFLPTKMFRGSVPATHALTLFLRADMRG